MPGVKAPVARKAALQSQWQAHIDDHVIALALAPGTSRWVAAAAVSGPIYLFDRECGLLVHALPGHAWGTMALAWHPNGRILASAGQDGKARLWDAATGTQLTEIDGGAAWVEHVAWLPVQDNRRPPLLATAAGRSLRIWNEEGELRHEYTNHRSTIAHLQWHTPRNELALATYGVLTVRNPDEPDVVRELPWKGAALVVAWSPDGQSIATGEQDAAVHFWNTATGQDLQLWGYATKVRELAWDHTSRYLATGGGNAITIWDCGGRGLEGQEPRMLAGHEAGVRVLAYQHHGALLASGGHDGFVMLWSPAEQAQDLARLVHPAPISQLAWLPDDRHLMIGAADGAVELLTVAR